MKSILLFISFCLAFGKVYSQETIFFKSLKKPNKKVLAYKLPISITCHFEDGTEKRYWLLKVVPDSFIMKEYFNKKENYSCSIDEINKIVIHKPGEAFIYGGFVASVVSSLYFSYIINKYIGIENVDVFFAYFSIPIVIISITSSLVLGHRFPKVIKIDDVMIFTK
jgi:hypothetical protein